MTILVYTMINQLLKFDRHGNNMHCIGYTMTHVCVCASTRPAIPISQRKASHNCLTRNLVLQAVFNMTTTAK